MKSWFVLGIGIVIGAAAVGAAVAGIVSRTETPNALLDEDDLTVSIADEYASEEADEQTTGAAATR